MNTVTIKTSEATGVALDWAVAKCEGYVTKGACKISGQSVLVPQSDGRGRVFSPSSDWSIAGPIIERERLHLCPIELEGLPAWQCWIDYGMSDDFETDSSPLIAAMRCYVASKMGDTVEVPGELLP